MGTVVIGVAGASCSGKTTLADSLASLLDANLLKIDDYYWPLDHLSYDARCGLNFDHPDRIDHHRLVQDVRDLVAGKTIEAPRYDFTRHTRFEETHRFPPKPILVIEGLFTFCYADLVDLCDVRIFVEASDAVCLERRLQRDVCERGRTPEEVISRFNDHVWPMYLEHISPSAEFATVRVSGTEPTEQNLTRLVAQF